MSLQSKSRNALEILERVQESLSLEEFENKDGLASLIYLLDSPLFNQILSVQDSLHQLKQLQKRKPLEPDEFEIDAETGKLIVHSQDDGLSLSEGTPRSEQSEHVAESPSLVSAGFEDPTLEKNVLESGDGRDILNISLYKAENSSLGFSVVGLRSENKGELGIFVQEIQPGGIAARDGRLQENDQILAINEQVLDASISHQQAISILQSTKGSVELTVARGTLSKADTPPPAEVEPNTPDSNLDRTPSAISEANSDMVLGTEWTQLEVIDLINDGSGLGFGIIGGKSTGVVVKTILPGGVADRDGRLRSGDHLMQIGAVHVRGLGSDQVASVLRHSGAHVRLIVARSIQEPNGVDNLPNAPIVPTHQLDEHLHHFSETLRALDNAESADLMGMAEQMNDASYSEQQYIAGLPQYNTALMNSQSPNDSQTYSNVNDEIQVFEVDLVKGNQGLGITIAGYVAEPATDDLSGIFVRSIGDLSATAIDGRVQVNDQIIEVDGQSLEGYNNQQAVEVLKSTGQVVHLKLVRYLQGAKYEQLQQYANETLGSTDLDEPDPSERQLSLDDINLKQMEEDYSGELDPVVDQHLTEMWQQRVGEDYKIVVAQLSKFREGGGLGISLEGTVDVENGVEVRPHHYIRSVLPDGPIGINGRLTSGDELLEVNGKQLLGLNHVEVVGILKDLPQHVRIVCARKTVPDENIQYTSANNETNEPVFEFQSSILKTDGSKNLSHSPENSVPSEIELVENSRLYKAKSDQIISVSTELQSHSNSNSEDMGLVKGKARSLELENLAMWSEEPEVIELHKGAKGLGFSILDYQDPINPSDTVIVIRSLVPGGVAQQDGRLVPGDRLIFVNDINLENANLEEAVEALKGAERGMVRVGVCKPLPLEEIGESSTDPDELEAFAVSEEITADFTLVSPLPAKSAEVSTPPPPQSQPPPLSSSSNTSPASPNQLNSSAALQSPRQFKPIIPKKPTDGSYFSSISPVTSSSYPPDLVIETDKVSSNAPHSPRSPKFKPLSPRGKFGGLMTTPPSFSDSQQFSNEASPASNNSNSLKESPRNIFKISPHSTKSEENLFIAPTEKNLNFKPTIAPKPKLSSSTDQVLKGKAGGSSPTFNVIAQTKQVESEDETVSQRGSAVATSCDLTPKESPTVSTTQPQQHSGSITCLSSVPSTPHVFPTQLQQTIKVKKASDQLGITVEAIDNGVNGCVVKTILPSGAIAKDGRIGVGDYIVSVNNESTRHITNAQARAIIRRASLLGTDISITYISLSVTEAHVDSSHITVKDHQSPVKSPSQLSPNSSLQEPNSSGLKLAGGSQVDGGRSATTTTNMLSSPTGYIAPIPDSAVIGLLSNPQPHSSLGAKSYQNSTSTAGSNSIKPSSAVASSWGKPRTVQIDRKEGESLGISIVGGRVDLFNVSPDTQRSISGIFIKHVLEDSPAGRNGTLNTGDRILQVDGVNLREATHDAAVDAIKKSKSPVTFVVQSLVDPDWKNKISSEPAEKRARESSPLSVPLSMKEEDEFGYSVGK